MHDDPISLYVALDKDGKAEGTLYLDDGKSYGYRDAKNIYVKIKYDNGKMTAEMINAGIETKVWLEKVVVQGVENGHDKKCTVNDKEVVVDVEGVYHRDKKVLVVRKPGVNMGHEWNIQC